MELVTRVVLKDVHRKIAVSGNVYHEIEVEETLPVKDENGKNISKTWQKLYMPEVKNEDFLRECVGTEVKMKANLYFHERMVETRKYQDLRLTVIDINDINTQGSGNTEE